MGQRCGGLFAGCLVVLTCCTFSMISIAQETSSFSSVFDVAIATNPSAVWELDLSASLTAVFERGNWRTASQSLFDDSGWIRQWFQSMLMDGSAVGSVEMSFLPSTAELDYAWLNLQMYMLGVELNGGLAIEPDGVGGWVELEGHDVAGIPVGLELFFGVDGYHNLIQTGCQVAFTGAMAWTEFNPIPCCPDFYVRPVLTLSDTGFESLEIEATLP
ncbi:hypothetical protein KAR02_08040, partial [Candidatus Bipolaricaulota bacterium]|nr:hypothetical protein [Candidatus Bipolaricaulota bacterium]